MKSRTPRHSRCSIGRGTKVKHSTAMEWDEWEKKRRLYSAKYSTGEDARITHSTGKALGENVRYRRKEYEADKRGGAKHPGFTYKHYRKNEK